MNILYCSSLCSLKTLDKLSQHNKTPLTSITTQKFHRLILKGLVANGIKVTAESITPKTSSIITKSNDDEEKGIMFKYIPTIEIPLIRHLLIVINTFYKTLKWLVSSKGDKVIICDVLNVSLSIGALFTKIFGVKIIGLMTDMPGMMVNNSQGIIGKAIKSTNIYLLKRYDGYVFLTEAMNEVINNRNKPYIVMEGLVDIDMKCKDYKLNPDIRNVIYAGGIHERYGIKMLIEGFQKVKGENLRLSVYGKLRGSISKHDMEMYERKDSRFHYYGLKPNEDIVKEELKAALLVNPRPTHEEFTKYSFPSKNMEYMVSGAPLLTTALPGMPEEYYNKIFLCEDETVSGFANALSKILSKSDEELIRIGKEGKEFVLKYKNNIIQTKRIIDLAKRII